MLRYTVALLIGAFLASCWFTFCIWLSQLPIAISDTSIVYTVRPWWRQWPVALMLLLVPTIFTWFDQCLRHAFGTPT